MRGRAGLRITLVCRQCDEIFSRVLADHKRALGSFCSKRCAGRFRSGVPLTELMCEACFSPFLKISAQVRRSQHHYCTKTCYLVTVDRSALGRAGAAAPKRQASAAVRFSRSQKAGFARARSTSKARLREIAMLGVEARRRNGSLCKPTAATLGTSAKIKRGLGWFGALIITTGASSPARGCEGGTARRVTNPVGTHPQKEEADA